jgi:glycosyltransferase involved in cell wall biosynthesis
MDATPFFSICVPQHNRTSFIVEAIRSIARQQFRDCEICVSDDCSNDGREHEVQAALEASGVPFTFQRRTTNGRYDKNLRSAMDLAKGEYLLLLANDDELKDDTTLERMADLLRAHPSADVMLTNFEDFATGVVTRRVERTGMAGFGPRVAVAAFRRFSFVSGIVLRRRPAELAWTDAWDGTEMYQMYVGCRMIASGGGLLEADVSTVRKDIRVPGEGVDSFAAKPRQTLRGIPVQPIPVSRVAALVVSAIEPHIASERQRTLGSLMLQYYGFLYPYWLFVYRRVQSWRYAAGVARAFVPSRSLAGSNVPMLMRAVAWASFAASTAIGLTVPATTSTWLFLPARRAARAAANLGRPAVRAGRS